MIIIIDNKTQRAMMIGLPSSKHDPVAKPASCLSGQACEYVVRHWSEQSGLEQETTEKLPWTVGLQEFPLQQVQVHVSSPSIGCVKIRKAINATSNGGDVLFISAIEKDSLIVKVQRTLLFRKWMCDVRTFPRRKVFCADITSSRKYGALVIFHVTPSLPVSSFFLFFVSYDKVSF